MTPLHDAGSPAQVRHLHRPVQHSPHCPRRSASAHGRYQYLFWFGANLHGLGAHLTKVASRSVLEIVGPPHDMADHMQVCHLHRPFQPHCPRRSAFAPVQSALKLGGAQGSSPKPRNNGRRYAGQLTSRKDAIVANTTLARVGLARGLHRYICPPPQHFTYPHGCPTITEVPPPLLLRLWASNSHPKIQQGAPAPLAPSLAAESVQ